MMGGGCESLVQKHLWRSAHIWLHVFLFPAMHRHPPVKIVPSMSQNTLKLWEYDFTFCDGRKFFIFDGELRNFPYGTALKIIITVNQFVILYFFAITISTLNWLIVDIALRATREYRPSILLWHPLETKSINPCHFNNDDNSYFM